ncbi:Putative tail fiber assembly protein p37 [Citrobacter europaeus]|nr:Putative tail fiber assembly protein p37 [Citrobacter europaeus]
MLFDCRRLVKMNKFYNGSFYLFSMKESYEKAGTWPVNGADVDDETMAIYTGVAPQGKILGSDKEGKPVWVNIPPLSAEQQIVQAEQKRTTLRSIADKEIAWRQDAVDSGIATEGETVALSEWKKYRVLLMRVDCSKAPDISWPEPPKD